jgi:hypothetical protein
MFSEADAPVESPGRSLFWNRSDDGRLVVGYLKPWTMRP